MCGILAIYNKDKHLNNKIRSMSLDIIKKVRHRGPDWSGIYTSQNAILAHKIWRSTNFIIGQEFNFSSKW